MEFTATTILLAFVCGFMFALVLLWPWQKPEPESDEEIIQQAIATLLEHGIYCNRQSLNQMIFRLCYERQKLHDQFKVIEALADPEACHKAIGHAANHLEVKL